MYMKAVHSTGQKSGLCNKNKKVLKYTIKIRTPELYFLCDEIQLVSVFAFFQIYFTSSFNNFIKNFYQQLFSICLILFNFFPGHHIPLFCYYLLLLCMSVCVCLCVFAVSPFCFILVKTQFQNKVIST